MVNFRIITQRRKDFLTLQEILDSTIKVPGVKREIRGLKIDDEKYDAVRVTYSGRNVSAYFEFNRANGFYVGTVVIEVAPRGNIAQFIQRSKRKLLHLKEETASEYLKQMISKYAKHPDKFFSKGVVNSKHIDSLVSRLISINPGIRSGKVCIKGTRLAVCDVIGDTWSLEKPRGYESEMYGPVPNEGIDAAFAFFMSNPDLVEQNYTAMTGGQFLPKCLLTYRI